jgi:2-oxoglutarate dehydrogenase E1 component
MLLPHGYEGQGPEHSSARLERFLQLCAQNNIQVCNCTTPASIFHLLRRQALQVIKKPLIIMSPKSLLRHKSAVSKLSEMDLNTRFQPVIVEDNLHEAQKIIFCSGKVYYDLVERRESVKAQKVSIVRLEQLYPFPISKISQILSKNSKSEFVWCQEEPSNMGAYSFVKPIFAKLGIDIKYAGRKSSSSPAAGFTSSHQSELNNLLQDAIK